MTDAPAARPPPFKRANCHALQTSELVTCGRCGLQWPAEQAAPPCQPVTLKHAIARMRSEVFRAEVDLELIAGAKTLPTDGGTDARRRLAELEGVLRMVELADRDPVIRERLKELAGKERG